MISLAGSNIIMPKDCAITIGKFDGLHKGHMSIISKLVSVAKAQRLASALLSFMPHPAAVLHNKEMPCILTSEEKRHILADTGIDYYIEYPFTKELSKKAPHEFMGDVLKNQLRAKTLIVGQDYRFGADAKGDVTLAKKLGRALEINVQPMPILKCNTGEVSATKVRNLIAAGNLADAKKILGRNFFIIGHVAQNGAIALPPNKLMPPKGDYIITVAPLSPPIPLTPLTPSAQQDPKGQPQKVILHFHSKL